MCCSVTRADNVALASSESANSTPRPFSFHPIQHGTNTEEEDGEIIAQEGIVDYKMK